MRTFVRCFIVFLPAFSLQACVHLRLRPIRPTPAPIAGTITDPSGAVVPGATVSINNPVSEYSRTATTDDAGRFNFPNIPFNPYHLSVTHAGFASSARDVDVRSTVAENVNIKLAVGTESTTVTVEGGEDLVENDPTFHTDIDRNSFRKSRWRASPRRSARSSLWPRPESPPIRTASSTASAITRRTPSPSMASPSPTSRARSSPISFRLMPFSRSK